MDTMGAKEHSGINLTTQKNGCGMEHTCNTFTDVREPVVAAPQQKANGEAAKTAGLPQGLQQNKAAKAARLQAEAETAKKIQAQYGEKLAALGIIDPSTGQKVTDVETLCALLQANQPIAAGGEERGAAIADANANTDANKEAFRPSPEGLQLQELQAENIALRQLACERHFADDLAKIRELNPNEAAQSIFDLGETFFTLRCNDIALQTAYEASRAEALRNTVPAPAAIGAVNGRAAAEKEFYTPAEVDRLTEKDFKKNPSLLEKVQKSMRLWQ